MSDREISELAKSHPDLIDTHDLQSVGIGKDSLVQAASLDLTIGEIFLPEASPNEEGGVNCPWTEEYEMESGSTVVVRTTEKLTLPSDVAGMGFPPARVTREGLLMTNPGHVDPGYSGYLTFTLINMGKKDFPLKVGERIVSLMLFRLGAPAEADWLARYGHPDSERRPVQQKTLNRLSKDFLQIDARATEIAENAEQAARKAGAFWTAVAGAVALLVPFAGNAVVGQFSQVEDVEDRVASIEAQIEDLRLDVRIADVEQQLSELDTESES